MTASTVQKRYTWIERRRIHRAAKAKLGQKMDDGDSYEDFMGECIANMMDDVATLDEDQALEMCEMIWNEEGGY